MTDARTPAGTVLGRAMSLARPVPTIVCFCLGLVALGWVGVALELKADRERTFARVMESNANLARVFEDHVVRTLRNADQLLLVVKELYETSGGRFDLLRYAQESRLDLQPYHIVTIVDANGMLEQATLPFGPTSVGDREFFRYHAGNPSGALHISRPLTGRTTGKPTVYLSRRIAAKDGSFGGMVAVGVDPRFFSDFYNQIDLGKGGVVTLAGRDGIVRARRSDDNSAVGQDISGAKAFAELASSRTHGNYINTSKLDGITRLLTYRALADYPLILLVGTAESTALAGYHARKASYLWTAGAISLTVLLFGALLVFQVRRETTLASRLREAEARAKLAVDSVSDYAIFTLDKRGFVTSWNAGAERIKAYRPDEILGQHFSRFYPPDEIELGTPQRLLDRAAAEGKVESEGWRLRKDGTRFWAHVVITALRNKVGALRGFGKITRDLTISKLTDDALQYSEARFRAIFNQAAVGICEVSPEGRWLRANPRLCEIVGYPLDELLRMNIRECTFPEDLEATSLHSTKLLASPGQSHSLEKRYLRKDGTIVWTSLSSVLVEAPGDEPDYIVGIVEDISARKHAEMEASELRARLEQRVEQRTAELAEANKRLESFTYSVSHDLRTPLRAISGFAQILARRHRDGLSDEGRHYMDNIVRASAQMGRLIEDLLNYSRLGRQAISMRAVGLQAIIGDIARTLQPKVSDTGAVLRIGPLPETLGDPTLLTQVFLNLLENALTYRRAGVAPLIEVSARTEGADVVVCVSDNGIGIDAAHFELIFGIFQRLHSEDEYPGTGIGLATVKQAAEMLGGNVWVESQPGTGSRFYVRLKAAGTAEAGDQGTMRHDAASA